jgi:hypothetical protein
VGGDTVFVIPIGPDCQEDFVADTIESVRYFAPRGRIILVDDSRRGMGEALGKRYELTSQIARAHGTFGNLYLNLSDGFQEALTRRFRILVRLDTDALITGSDFESKAIDRFESDERLGSLGSFRIGYDDDGVRNARWAKGRILLYFVLRAWIHPRAARTVAGLLRRARRQGYKLGESILGGAAVYRYEALNALSEAGLLGSTAIAGIGMQEDHLFGLCLFSIGYHLGEFGNRFDDLPMGVDWKTLPAAPKELMELGKSIIHSTKHYESMDEAAIRNEFRLARQPK